MGSWAWGHFAADWATKGIFQGERRFYLGPVVDDLFLTTEQFVYDGADNKGPEVRLTGAELNTFQSFQNTLNSLYGSDIIVEFAYNGNGVLEKVISPLALSFE
ncbi:unnamed protein product, partial [Choristocarpus tenellus]